MKFKQVIICFCALIVLFISSATTVYAAYEPPFKDIATAQGITWNDNYYCIFSDGSNYYICPYNYVNFNGNFGNVIRVDINSGVGTVKNSQLQNSDTECAVYKVSKSNPYDDWTKVYSGNIFNSITIPNISLVNSSTDIYNSSGEVVFTKTPLGQKPQGGTSPPTTPSSGSHLNLSTSMLSNVLSELIAVLPILFPVLISFIAIRKGLSFILTTLKTI